MSDTETFQIPLEAAEAYEAAFVPAIFAHWAPSTVDAARVEPGKHVLDVACGTGIVARTAADRLDGSGTVTGLDLNDAMLTVARRVRPDLEFRQGDAAALPFDDDAFDAITCQMALMFMPDRKAVFDEMARVGRAGAFVGLNVPAALEVQPAYRPFVEAAANHAGPQAHSLLSTYWSCGDLDALSRELTSSGLEIVDRRTHSGPARFASADDFVRTEVAGSPLAERVDDATIGRIVADVEPQLERYVVDATTFEIPLVCHTISARVER